MCLKGVCGVLRDPGEKGDGTYGVLKGIKNVLKWVTNIWPPLMGFGSSGTLKIGGFGPKWHVYVQKGHFGPKPPSLRVPELPNPMRGGQMVVTHFNTFLIPFKTA